MERKPRRCPNATLPMLLVVLVVAFHAVASATSTALQCNMTSDVQNDKERWSQLSGLVFSRDSHAATAFRDRIWIVGGVSVKYFTKRLEETTTRSDVVSSPNGISWTDEVEEAPFRRRYGHSLFTFTDPVDDLERLVMLGGFSPEPANDIWTSLDGKTWTETPHPATWPGRGYHCTVVFNQSVFILGGSPLSNDVWSATSVLKGDWQQHANAPWSPRTAHGCAAHTVVTNTTLGDASRQTFIFIMGGFDGSGRNDVWRMNIKGDWEQLLTAAPWKKRAWFSLVSFDSRTPGDVQLGSRLWLIGGGIVGKGIDKMLPFTDAWFTRNGSTWFQANSDTSGVSTADWSMVTLREKKVCTGKWGHTVVPFYRNVTSAFMCSSQCINEKNNTNLANQLIPLCDATTQIPGIPVQKTAMKGTMVFTMRVFPDRCDLCVGPRYQNITKLPALYLIAGNIGTQKVRDTFINSNYMLCEQNGEICSNEGVCTPEGICLCNSGKEGAFCETDSDVVFVEDATCFAPHSTVWMEDGSSKPISEVQIGDRVLAVNARGQPFASTVYYIPHEDRHQPTEFIEISFRLLPCQEQPDQPKNPSQLDTCGQCGICESQQTHGHSCLDPMVNESTIEMTPDHLVYIVLAAGRTTNVSAPTAPLLNSSSAQPYVQLTSLQQVAARELDRNATLVVFDPKAQLFGFAQVSGLRRTVRQGAVTVYTTSGTVLVNGVLCSNFADLYPVVWPRRRDFLPFAFFSSFRLAFALVPSPQTSHLLRLFMDAWMVPLLKTLWYLLKVPKAIA